MGGPAMIEAAGLGQISAAKVGPGPDLFHAGVIDLLVEDETAGAAAAKRCLSYFQGATRAGTSSDQRLLRGVVPENRRRAYDARRVIEVLADIGTVLELRGGWGMSVITSLARIGGRPFGVVASNPLHLGGAIDSDGADKGARFVQLCDHFCIPLVMLCDTPGFLVGPQAELSGISRHAARFILASSTAEVPQFTIVTRKGYGAAMMAFMAGGHKENVFNVMWPTAEFGGMGIEGSVRLAYARQLAEIDDPIEREAFFQARVDERYDSGKALNIALTYQYDAVIDPAETRDWILSGLAAASPLPATRRHPFVSPW
jgi:acetyl-CoA carboxylase carboxyltransferase component